MIALKQKHSRTPSEFPYLLSQAAWPSLGARYDCFLRWAWISKVQCVRMIQYKRINIFLKNFLINPINHGKRMLIYSYLDCKFEAFQKNAPRQLGALLLVLRQKVIWLNI